LHSNNFILSADFVTTLTTLNIENLSLAGNTILQEFVIEACAQGLSLDEYIFTCPEMSGKESNNLRGDAPISVENVLPNIHEDLPIPQKGDKEKN